MYDPGSLFIRFWSWGRLFGSLFPDICVLLFTILVYPPEMVAKDFEPFEKRNFSWRALCINTYTQSRGSALINFYLFLSLISVYLSCNFVKLLLGKKRGSEINNSSPITSFSVLNHEDEKGYQIQRITFILNKFCFVVFLVHFYCYSR